MTSGTMFAQSSTQIVDDYLNQAQSKGELKTQITYNVVTENVIGNEVGDYVKIEQTVNGIPVYHTFGTFQIKDKKVLNFNNNFVSVNTNNNLTVSPKLLAENAVQKFAASIGKEFVVFNDAKNSSKEQLISKTNKDNQLIFSNDNPKILTYYNTADGLKLGWLVLASIKEANDEPTLNLPLYELVIDANTGELLSKNSIINSCTFDHNFSVNNVYHNNEKDYNWIKEEFTTKKVDANTGTYRVIPANFESPLKHDFVLISNASDPIASKEGWHKLLPVGGLNNPELSKYHTIGNNAHVSYDIDGVVSDLILDSGGLLASLAEVYMSQEAYGGEELLFDFPNPGKSTNYNPLDYTEAATTQMFYSINSIHDILYYHGFNPKSGSFQANVGEGAHTVGLTTGGLGKTRTVNNAFMVYSSSLSPNPTTVFFTFETPTAAGVLQIKDGVLKGDYQGGVGNNSGFKYGVSPAVSGNFVLINDNIGTDSNDGCEPIINGDKLKGNIAVVNRGTCSFEIKISEIKKYNPSGILILNNSSNSLIGFGVGDPNFDINYPIVGVNLEISDKLRQTLGTGTAVSGTIPSADFKLTKRDSSFDSEVILHEYTHAVSGRLSGGSIGGEEGMGEGWSDYVAINLTQQPNQIGKDQINMGSYAFGGGGLRRLPYTTDMSVNPDTYDYLKVIGPGSQPHATGYVWATMLWEMHWKFVDKYGFNPDFKSNTGGNNMALDLVLEGIKMQKANPGFVDGRDAILQADVVMNRGANQCMIWEAFAKRGLGYTANQGDPAIRTDGKQAFDLPPSCEELGTDDLASTETSIYPNPAKDVVYIMSKEGISKAELIDMTGRVISTQAIKMNQSKGSVDTSNLSKGIYILKLYTKDGVVTKKVIKN